jgi:undecaprenyl diphosphate synthase
MDKNELDFTNIPKHVAIIMDGNGRWAKQKGKMRLFGHSNAVTSVRETVEAAAEIGVKVLTLFAFSTENWSRPQNEVSGLMDLLVKTIGSEIKNLHKNQIKLITIGDTTTLPAKAQIELNKAKKLTANNTHMTLNIAISYSSKWEIVEATKQLALKSKQGLINPNEINETLFEQHLSTAGLPDPDLLIRTSGEYRISNFLLWQIAYTELYFTDVLWPDFRKKHFWEAIKAYQNRERRFGKTSEQLKTNA